MEKIINKIGEFILGITTKGCPAYTKTTFTTVYPDETLSFNEWASFNKVSSRFVERAKNNFYL